MRMMSSTRPLWISLSYPTKVAELFELLPESLCDVSFVFADDANVRVDCGNNGAVIIACERS